MTAMPSPRLSAGRLVLEWVPRLLVAALFIYTGVTKIADPETFIKEVRAYEMAPLVFTNLVAFVLPWVEVFAGLLLVAGIWRMEARVVIAGMLVMFIGAKGILLLQGKVFDCGCVPTDSFLHVLFEGWTGVITNVCLLAFLAIEGYCEYLRRRSTRTPAAPVEAQEAVPA